jgi:peroxiredoxin Q/BCP
VVLVGASFDSPEANATFKTNNGYQYELWSDTDKTLALYYGAASSAAQAMAGRVTRILDAEGVLVLEYDAVNPALHPQQVLEDCQVLFGP